MLSAGSMRGLRAGTVLAVYPHAEAGQADWPVGHVRVTSTGDYVSRAEPCAHASLGARWKLPTGARCKVVRLAHASPPLRLALHDDVRLPLAVREKLQQKLQGLVERPGSLCEWAAEDRPDWWVRTTPGTDELLLVDASDQRNVRRRWIKERASFGPFEGADAPEQLADRARRLARARNLLALAGFLEERPLTTRGPDVEVQLLRYRDEASKVGDPIRLDLDGTAWGVRPTDQVAVRVSNDSRSALDVTVLAVDEDDRMTVVFPRERERNRVEAGQSLTTHRQKPPEAGRGQRLVVLAVATGEPPVSYGFLESAAIVRARERARAEGIAERALDGPLGRLLQGALYGEGQERGVEVKDLQRVAFRTLTWRPTSRVR